MIIRLLKEIDEIKSFLSTQLHQRSCVNALTFGHRLEIGPSLRFFQAGDQRNAIAQRSGEIALGHADAFAQVFE